MSKAILGLGSNLGNRCNNLHLALEIMSENVGDLLNQSDKIVTKSWGYDSENTFLNMVAIYETSLSPIDLLNVTQNIEKKIGRTQKSTTVYADRIIDIDILFYDNRIINEPSLTIPHPLIAKREFVLKPLNEVLPNFIHPVFCKTISELYLSLNKRNQLPCKE